MCSWQLLEGRVKTRRDDRQEGARHQGRPDEVADCCDEMQPRAMACRRSAEIVVEQVVERAVVLEVVVVDVDVDVVAVGIECGGMSDVHAHGLVVMREHVGSRAVHEREYRDHGGKGFPGMAGAGVHGGLLESMCHTIGTLPMGCQRHATGAPIGMTKRTLA